MTIPFTVISDPNIGRSQIPCEFFSSVYHCCSSHLFITRPFRSSPSIVSALVGFYSGQFRSSRPFGFSPSIVSAHLVSRSDSVRRLFLLFSSINSFSSRQFCCSPSIVSALLVARSASVHQLFLLDLLVIHSAAVHRLFMLFSSINRFSSHQFHSSLSITSALLMNGFGRS